MATSGRRWETRLSPQVHGTHHRDASAILEPHENGARERPHPIEGPECDQWCEVARPLRRGRETQHRLFSISRLEEQMQLGLLALNSQTGHSKICEPNSEPP